MASGDKKNNRPRRYPFRKIWQHFLDGQPEYLARHYWWAYLWRIGVWFFDHQPIINAILFGQYRKLDQRALRDCTTNRPPGRLLQLTCVYGELTPSLLRALDGEDMYLMDVAAIQLAAARGKLSDSEKKRLLAARMNAESLAYRDDAFATILIFFLLHELPPDARRHALDEALRVLRPGGRLVITEYGHQPRHHLLYRLWPMRVVLLRLEPFLGAFWREDLTASLQQHARAHGKTLRQVDEFHCFDAFYRVCMYELDQAK